MNEREGEMSFRTVQTGLILFGFLGSLMSVWFFSTFIFLLGGKKGEST
jgi:hypothetical protein